METPPPPSTSVVDASVVATTDSQLPLWLFWSWELALPQPPLIAVGLVLDPCESRIGKFTLPSSLPTVRTRKSTIQLKSGLRSMRPAMSFQQQHWVDVRKRNANTGGNSCDCNGGRANSKAQCREKQFLHCCETVVECTKSDWNKWIVIWKCFPITAELTI